MTYRTEFPDFPETDWPEMPEGFEDTSWHNDVCPNITCEALNLAVYIDYLDPAKRECGENGKRFIVYRIDGDTTITDDAVDTDNWSEVLDFIARERAVKASGVYVLHDDSDPRCGRVFHVMLGDTRKGIAYSPFEVDAVVDEIIKWKGN